MSATCFTQTFQTSRREKGRFSTDHKFPLIFNDVRTDKLYSGMCFFFLRFKDKDYLMLLCGVQLLERTPQHRNVRYKTKNISFLVPPPPTKHFILTSWYLEATGSAPSGVVCQRFDFAKKKTNNKYQTGVF